MPVPGFDIHGVIPPFTGVDPVASGSAALSPYVATPTEIVNALGTSIKRRDILAKWLDHRAQLRALGMTGFQWLDGSFVEKKTPNDLDVVSFLRRPPKAKSEVEIQALVGQNLQTFSHAALKASHQLDAYFVDMDGSAETIVEMSRYFCGLFSHRRNDSLWKGMLKADLKADTLDDELAVIELENAAAMAVASGATE